VAMSVAIIALVAAVVTNMTTRGSLDGEPRVIVLVVRVGFESLDHARIDVHLDTSAREASASASESARTPVDADAIGLAIGPTGDLVEVALAKAREAAAVAGRFDVVAQLARNWRHAGLRGSRTWCASRGRGRSISLGSLVIPHSAALFADARLV